MLSASAWNAFLKTLRSRPRRRLRARHHRGAQGPATIVDRCHRFDFQRPSLEQIAGVLRRVAAEEQIELPDPLSGCWRVGHRQPSATRSGPLEQLVTYGGAKVELDDVRDILGVADAELVLDAATRSPTATRARRSWLSSGCPTRGRLHPVHARPVAHLRHLFVVQTLGEVPDSFSVTAEHTDRLATQAERFSPGEICARDRLPAAAIAAVRTARAALQLEMARLKATQPQRTCRCRR